MATVASARTPAHLWIVGLLATGWNAIGAYDYVMTRTRNMEYLSSVPGVSAEEMLAYIDAFPLWSQIGWALGVWGALLGSLLLLARSSYAVHSFALSLFGIALSLGYTLFGPPGPAGTSDGMMAYFPYIIIAIGVLLMLYSTSMLRRGVLR